MALGNPIEAYMRAAEMKNRNRQQANQDMGSIGQSFGQGMASMAEAMQQQRQKAQWQKTINEMMMNPNTPPQLRQMMPVIGQIGMQSPAVAGEMIASASKSQTRMPYRESKFMGKGGHPLLFDETTGDYKESGVDAIPPKGAGTDLGTVKWNDATSDEQQLAINVYNGNVRPYDLGYRERSKVVVLANEYANKFKLPPFQSFGADVKKRGKEAFTSGKQSMNALSLNTALGHLGSAYGAYQGIENTDQKWLNQPLNVLRTQTNDGNVIKLGVTLNALRGELATVFKGTGGTDQEISSWREYLTENLTPAQINAAVPQIDELLRSRLSALDYSRGEATSNRPGSGPLLSPHAAELSKKLGKKDAGGVQKFSSAQEASAAGLADGTRVEINGVPGTWRN